MIRAYIQYLESRLAIQCKKRSRDPTKSKLGSVKEVDVGYKQIRLFPQVKRVEYEIHTAQPTGGMSGLVELRASNNGPYHLSTKWFRYYRPGTHRPQD